MAASSSVATMLLLIAQEDHLVVEEDLADLRDDVVAERTADVDAGDLRANVAGQATDADPGR